MIFCQILRDRPLVSSSTSLTDGYTAQAGGVLVARASDDFEVVRVVFALRDAEGAVLAEGDAILRHTVWHFTVPPPIDGRRPISVAVSAHDRPGNVTTGRFPLP